MKMRAKAEQSVEEHYTTCEDRDYSDFWNRAELLLSAMAAGGECPSDPSSDENSFDSVGGRSARLPPRRSQSHSHESDDRLRNQVLPQHPHGGNSIKTKYTIESPKTSSTDSQPLIGSRKGWKSWRTRLLTPTQRSRS